MSKYEFIFSYKFLMNLRLVFGNYYDLKRSPRINFMTKCYCVVFGVSNIIQVVSGLNLNDVWVNTTTYQLLMLAHFVITIALPLIFKADDFSESSLLIRGIDNELGLSRADLKSYVPMSIITIGLFVQCSGIVYYAGVMRYPVFTLFVFMGVMRFFTITSSTCSLITELDCCRNRLKVLRKTMKNQLKINNQEEKIRCVKSFVTVYKSLLRYLCVTEKNFAYVVRLNIGINMFKIFIFTFYLIDPSFTFNFSIIILWFSQISFEVIVQFIPALLMELSADELDAIKATLADELIECEDNELRTVLYDALDYIEVCPVIFNLWPDFPMNLNLVLRFVGICSTYMISLLQFKY